MQRPKYKRIFWEDGKTKVNASNLNRIERELERLSLDSLSPSQIVAGPGIKIKLLESGAIYISSLITSTNGEVVLGKDDKPEESPYFKLRIPGREDIVNVREESADQGEDKMITLLTKNSEITGIKVGETKYNLVKAPLPDDIVRDPDIFEGNTLKPSIMPEISKVPELERRILELETKLKNLEKMAETRDTGKLDSELASMFNESWEHLDKRQGLRKVISEVKDIAFKSDLKEKQ